MYVRTTILIISLCFTASSLAATVSSPPQTTYTVSLSLLNGTHHDNEYIDAYFEFESPTFSEVSAFWFDWAATGTPGEIKACEACSITPYKLITTAIIMKQELSGEYSIWGDQFLSVHLDPDDPTHGVIPYFPFEGFPTGKGYVSMSFEKEIPGIIINDATIDISDITLTASGYVVPLPAGLPLLLSGLAGLLFFQKKRKSI